MLCRNRGLLRILLQLGLELRLRNLTVPVLVEHAEDDAATLLVCVDVDDLEHFKHLRVRQELILVRIEVVEETVEIPALLVHVRGDVSQSLFLNSFLHRSSVIDAFHNLCDLHLLHIGLHVCEICDPVHADVVRRGGIMGLQQIVELPLIDVLVSIAIALKLLL